MGTNATLDEEVVRWGYRLILGREPENNHVIEHHRALGTLTRLREVLLSSAEFKEMYASLPVRVSDGAAARLRQELQKQPDKIMLLHIPKTGGTTLHEVLAHNYRPDHVCPERFNRLHEWSLDDLASYRMFSGHFDFLGWQLIPGRVRVVTMLREPVAPLMSMMIKPERSWQRQ